MEVKIIFQTFLFLATQLYRAENYLFRNALLSVLGLCVYEILIFEILMRRKFFTSVFSLQHYCLCEINRNILLVITFLLIQTNIINI